MLSYAADSDAPAEVAWRLYAEPALWPRWAPQLRGAWGLGSPEVEVGRHGAARLLGVVPVPARILAKDPGRSWSWQAALLQLDHRVEPREGGGCRVVCELVGPPGTEALLRVTYGPVCGLLMRHLARVAEREAAALSVA